MKAINNMPVPDLDIPEHGWLRRNVLLIDQSAKNVEITPADENAYLFSVRGLRSHFHSGDFVYKIWLFAATGQVDADCSDFSMVLKIQLGTQQLDNGRMVPKINILRNDVNLGPFSIHFSGNIFSSLAQLFEPFFHDVVVGQIQNQIADALRDQLPAFVNQLIADQHGATELYNGIMLDWTVPSAPVITDKSVMGATRGLFFPQGQTQDEPMVEAPEMPFFDSQIPSKVQYFLSNYLADSGAATLLKEVGLNIWI